MPLAAGRLRNCDHLGARFSTPLGAELDRTRNRNDARFGLRVGECGLMSKQRRVNMGHSPRS